MCSSAVWRSTSCNGRRAPCLSCASASMNASDTTPRGTHKDGPRTSMTKLAHVAELVVLERPLDFGATVHYKRTLSHDRFGDGLAVHHEQLRVRFRFHLDAMASAGE